MRVWAREMPTSAHTHLHLYSATVTAAAADGHSRSGDLALPARRRCLWPMCEANNSFYMRSASDYSSFLGRKRSKIIHDAHRSRIFYSSRRFSVVISIHTAATIGCCVNTSSCNCIQFYSLDNQEIIL